MDLSKFPLSIFLRYVIWGQKICTCNLKSSGTKRGWIADELNSKQWGVVVNFCSSRERRWLCLSVTWLHRCFVCEQVHVMNLAWTAFLKKYGASKRTKDSPLLRLWAGSIFVAHQERCTMNLAWTTFQNNCVALRKRESLLLRLTLICFFFLN